MQLKKAIAAAAVVLPLCGVGTAHAVTAPSSDIFADFVGPGSFSNDYTFSVTNAFDLAGAVFSLGISNLQVALNGAALADTNSSPFIYQFGSTFLSPGSYTATFSGSGSKLGGIYVAGISMTPAVPEPSAVVMALAALGVLGGLARRKSR